jgi:hypothetical protein
MEMRHLVKAEVEAVLATPAVVRPAKEGRTAAWAQIEGRGILVIHEPSEGGSVPVVTVYPQRRRPKS